MPAAVSSSRPTCWARPWGNASEFEGVLEAVSTGLRPVVDSAHPLDDGGPLRWERL